MTKKEIAEIRKQLTPANCNITKIATCLVTKQLGLLARQTNAFLSLPEEEEFMYLELFKKSLSGGVGKTLFDVPFPLEEHGEKQEFLERLRKSRLEDDGILEEFFSLVAENYASEEDYLVVLIHGMYDVPGRTSGGEELSDASEEVYEYIHCILCPVSLSKPGLSFDAIKNAITDRIREQVVGTPLDGFLYPAFNGRAADVNSILYYAKKPSDMQERFLDALAGNPRPCSDDEKAVWLKKTIEGAGKNAACSFPQAQGLFEGYAEIALEDAPLLDASGMRQLAENAGMEGELADAMEEGFRREISGKGDVPATGFMDTKAFTVKTPSVTVKTVPEHADALKVEKVGGRLSLVIPLDTNMAEVNGIPALLLADEPCEAG